MENNYVHQKCHTVLSKINQIVGGQVADRKEEGPTYVPVYVDVTDGTIKVGTRGAGSLKPENHYVQRVLSTERHKILPSSQSESNNCKDLSCGQTFLAPFKRTQSDEHSVLHMLLELEPVESDGLNRLRSLSPDICIDIMDDSSTQEESESTLYPTQATAHPTNIPHNGSYNQLNSVSKSNMPETISIDIRVLQPQDTLLYEEKDPVLEKMDPVLEKMDPVLEKMDPVLNGKKGGSRICSRRYRLRKRLETEKISEDVQKLIKVGSKLRNDVFKLISTVKHMKLLVLATGKFKPEVRQLHNTPNHAHSAVAGYNHQDSTSRINNFISQLEYNMQQECGHRKALKQEIIDDFAEVLKTNIKIKTDVSKLIGTVKQIKLLLLTSGEFKSAYLKKLQKHLLVCRCKANKTIDADLILSYQQMVGSSCRSYNCYNQIDLTSEPSTSSTYINADKQSGNSSIMIFEHNYQRPNYAQEKLQMKKIIEDTGKVLTQMKKIQSNLSSLTVSVKSVILMSGKFLTKSSSGLKNYNL